VRLVGAVSDISARKEADEALREALEQQTATREVLQVINSSPGDLAPVFEAIVEKAHSLCGAPCGSLQLWDGENFRGIAMRGFPEPMVEALRQGYSPGPNHPCRGLIDGARIAHCADMAEVDDAVTRLGARLSGIRTVVYVALRKDDVLLGQIVAGRREVRPFTDRELALLENFAAQAVIAIENARLLTETREALEQQTAAAEVLKAISRSTFDLDAVLQTVVSAAHRLCRSDYSVIFRQQGDEYRWAAGHGISAEYEARERRAVIRPGTDTVIGRAVLAGHAVQIADAKADPLYRGEAENDARAMLGVPLLRDGVAIGGIGLARNRVEPFTSKQAELVTTFADQAVIAIENARLLTETREALDQQTATAEVLQVINSSPGDLAPVFDATLEKAMRLCEASHAHLFALDGEQVHPVAVRGDALFANWLLEQLGPHRVVRGSSVDRLRQGEPFVHVLDARETEAYRTSPQFRELIDISGCRSAISVALRREDTVLGVIAIYRQEVRRFSDKQIALLQNFAAQAVIAMENARLLNETRGALEQQTATAEVLQVINSSPGDLAPVFDAMLEKALSLCGAAFGQLVTFDGVVFRAAAWRGYEPGPSATAPAPGMALHQLVHGEQFVHIPDITADDVYRSGNAVRRRLADEYGGRTAIWVALRKDAALLGAFVIYRTEVRPFSEKQIALLQNFAAQAVIAIDNAQLLKEIRQRQAELRVTFDNMGDGVAMFDGELRLAAWNRNFQEMLDLPDAFLAERPSYAEYFHYLAERGEYGSADLEAELRRAVEDTNREMRFERTRPDGRIIEVRRNAVPAGGFVLIYADVTERKRAEAEIRAARDTAEGALRELQAAQARLLHAQKMAALGQLTAGIAHEIKNPLNFVNNFADPSIELFYELKETAEPAVMSLDERYAHRDRRNRRNADRQSRQDCRARPPR
jgi:PAS domain S-box-containing protein